jgi:hypothetical protein
MSTPDRPEEGDSVVKAAVPHPEIEADLAPGSLLVRSTIWNLTGYIAPLVVAVVVIPFLIKRLGTPEYGVLTIAWGIVGYFGVFDMGLSNAITKFVAERIGRGSPAEINDIFHTGLVGRDIAGSVGKAARVLLAIRSRGFAGADVYGLSPVCGCVAVCRERRMFSRDARGIPTVRCN